MKRLSIIVPLYDSARFMPKCIESLLQQDIPADEYEILLINDGSPDNSEELAREYAAEYENVRVLSKENGGTSSARNMGISNARGKYLYFVDPDDFIQKNSLGEILHIMDSESLDVLRFGYTEVDLNGNQVKSCKHPERPDYSSGIMDGYSFMAERLGTACYVWSFLFRTDMIRQNNLFFNEDAYIDDTPWLPQVLALAKRVDSIGVKRHFYTIREGSLVRAGSENTNKIISAQMWLIKELERQMASVENAKGKLWYDKMVAHTVLSMLSVVGSREYGMKQQVCSWLVENEILPLSLRGSVMRTGIRYILINISPNMFCDIVHKKHS